MLHLKLFLAFDVWEPSFPSKKIHENDNNMDYLNHNFDIRNFYIYNTTNFTSRNLAIIVIQNLLFIGSYRKDMNVIHLFVLFEHRCCVHYFDTNVTYLFILFKDECFMSICIVYTQKLCTRLSCLNNAWRLRVYDTNPWNNIFRTDLEWFHEAYKFVMKLFIY
jgi:hypothetical protein